MAKAKLLSAHTTASAPALIQIYHHQLKDLLVCPNERGIVSYISGRLIVSHDIRRDYKPPSPLANLDFEPNCLSSGCGLIVAGGGLAELFIGALPTTTTDAAPQLLWSQTKQLPYPASINNSLLVTNQNLVPSSSLAPSLTVGTSPLASVEPRLFVSNNDEKIKVFSVATAPTDVEDRVSPVGSLKLHTPVNHTSISPDGRTLLAVGDTNEVFLNDITPGDEVTFSKVATYRAGSDANFSSAWSSDGRKFAVACQDGQVTIWDVRSSKPLSIFRCGPQPGRSRPQSLRAQYDGIRRPVGQTIPTNHPTYTYPTSSLVDYRLRVDEILSQTSPRSPAVGNSREPRLEAFLREARSRRQSDASVATISPISTMAATNPPATGLVRNPAIVRRRRMTEAGTSTTSSTESRTTIRLGDPMFSRTRRHLERVTDAATAEPNSNMEIEPPFAGPSTVAIAPLTGDQPTILPAARDSSDPSRPFSLLATDREPRPGGMSAAERARRTQTVRTYDDLLTNVISRSYLDMPSSNVIQRWPHRHPTLISYGEPGRGSGSWMEERSRGSDSGAESRNASRVLKFSPGGMSTGARDVLVFTEDTSRFHVVDGQTFNEHAIITVPDAMGLLGSRDPADAEDDNDDEHDPSARSSGDYMIAADPDAPTDFPAPHITGLSFDPTGGWIYVGTQKGVFEWEIERQAYGWDKGYVSWA